MICKENVDSLKCRGEIDLISSWFLVLSSRWTLVCKLASKHKIASLWANVVLQAYLKMKGNNKFLSQKESVTGSPQVSVNGLLADIAVIGAELETEEGGTSFSLLRVF